MHRGVTFEANLGIGFIHASSGNASDNSDASIGGLDLGVGGWLSPQLALTVRLSGVTYSKNGGRLSDLFFGPSLQYWFDPNFWAGGGIGLGGLVLSSDSSTNNSDSIKGFSFDLRGGYSFASQTTNTFNVSVELNPGFYSNNGSSATYTGLALLVGYQYL